ncbi:MAG: complex I NDUFA9 subunit family protein [Candidatus Sulfobium sp.]|jgi:uncharacterized protein YbjT (DUF2867 family)
MIFIAGATGFIGSHLIDDLSAKGHRLKCLVRSGKAKERLTAMGIETVTGDIREPDTLKGVLGSGDVVIHLVGIIEEKGRSTFRSVHVEGTSNLVDEAKRAGAGHFFYQSALGADKNSWSAYLKTKAEAEDIVKKSGLASTVFRPSLIIGPWDGFTSKVVDMIKLAPVLPIPGKGSAKFQPLYVKDWVRCIGAVIDAPQKYLSTYEIGGPEQLTYSRMLEIMSEALGRKKTTMSIPMGLMKFSASLLENILPSPPVTTDQLRLLEMDNICDIDAVEKNFGFKPVKFEEALREFINK